MWCVTVCIQHHVHELNKYTSMSGYVKTLSRASGSSVHDDGCGVYALDCEMVCIST